MDRKTAITGGQVLFHGGDLTRIPANQMRNLRGNRIAMIFQDPMVALNPVSTIGEQMNEAILAHCRISRAEAHPQPLPPWRASALLRPKAGWRLIRMSFRAGCASAS